MRVRILVLSMIAALILSMAACSKQDEGPITKDNSGNMPPGHPSATGQPSGPMVAPVMEIVVPDNVKGAWESVVLSLENKKTGEVKDFALPINSELAVPDTGLKIIAGDFLPDFRMTETTITSHSAETNNPAIKVKVIEGGKEIFDGWLYARFPAIHPFQHEVYGITLKGGNKKG